MNLKAVWNYMCPRCRQSYMFKEPIQLTAPLDMKEKCRNCNLKFEPEPGFYFGAMFVSYGLACLSFLPLAMLLVFVFDWDVMSMMYLVFFLYFSFFILIMRLSRSIWAHFAIKFDPKYAEKNDNSKK